MEEKDLFSHIDNVNSFFDEWCEVYQDVRHSSVGISTLTGDYRVIKRQEKKILKRVADFYIANGTLDRKDVYFDDCDGYVVDNFCYSDGFYYDNSFDSFNLLIRDMQRAKVNIDREFNGLSWANKINHMLRLVSEATDD